MFDKETATQPSVVHTITETSAKLLAETLIEMGSIANHNKDAINTMRWQLENEFNEIKRKTEEVIRLRAVNKDSEERLVAKERQLIDFKKQFKDLEVHIQTTIQSNILLNVALDELLKRYKISRKDKMKIKKLREIKETPGDTCGQERTVGKSSCVVGDPTEKLSAATKQIVASMFGTKMAEK